MTAAVSAVRTSAIAGSIDDTGRRADSAWTSPGTRYEREELAAIHRVHSHPTAQRYSRRRIRPPPTPVRQEQTSQGRLQRRQGGSSSRLLFGSSPAINIGVAGIVPAGEEGAGRGEEPEIGEGLRVPIERILKMGAGPPRGRSGP